MSTTKLSVEDSEASNTFIDYQEEFKVTKYLVLV